MLSNYDFNSIHVDFFRHFRIWHEEKAELFRPMLEVNRRRHKVIRSADKRRSKHFLDRGKLPSSPVRIHRI